VIRAALTGFAQVLDRPSTVILDLLLSDDNKSKIISLSLDYPSASSVSRSSTPSADNRHYVKLEVFHSGASALSS
jgi:hypothetical protein